MRSYKETKPEHKAMIFIHFSEPDGDVSWSCCCNAKWLRDQSISKPGFFFDIELDDERRIHSVFWTDAVMISNYTKFGDFVSFDTTYRTNDTARPLGIFVGFNHHKCTTIFGAALMYDETGKYFKWLFETFLKCVNHIFSKTLMTYQAPAITLAIRDVFSGDEFTAGKTTTQLSEQLNEFARHYLNSSMHVSELMRRFQSMVVDLRFNEKSRDFYMQHTIPANNFKNSSLMSHAASVFTPQIFNEIQHEFEAGMTYTIKKTLDVEQYFCSSFQETMRIFSGSCKLILVQRWENEGTPEKTLIEEEVVWFDIERSM
ncbi:hypothetical protein LIER_42981 [Lithospermum erythrorhizon]|uniref:MULE transposase domain-containing protein n=1 Tax=Lithospermum erythrorhizon TaxID=34254 RepID=A0AAV3P8X9_LITER